MKYADFLTIVRQNNLYIFTANDIGKYFSDSSPKTIQNQLQLWSEKKVLTRLKRGLYKVQFPEGGPVVPDLYTANRLYEPSYVSLETALSFYSIIPEVAAEVTSVTTKQTKLFSNETGRFKYRSCKKKAFCGYEVMSYSNYNVLIAEKEKAVADFVYFKLRDSENFGLLEEERFDEENLNKLSWDKVFEYAAFYNKKTLLTVKKIREEAR